MAADAHPQVDQAHRVLVEQADWTTLLPFLRLFQGFRMAIQPAKLLLALMMVLLTYLGGLGLDLIWGPQVYRGEVSRYLALSGEDYQRWLAISEADRSRAAEQARQLERPYVDPRSGIFETTLAVELDAFKQMVVSATSLDFGFSAFLAGEGLEAGGVLGAIGIMVVAVPAWLYATHPGFLAVFLLFAFLLTALFGGAITRLAAVQATQDLRPSSFQALRFTVQRYPWYVLAPVIPLAVAVAIGLLLALVGLALFNLPVLDVVGALLFGPLLLGGLVVALILIGLLVGASLLLPALAVEGTDAFDAISRAFNYVLGRPWRYLFYNAVMLVYGAVTYLFVGLVIYLTLWVTKTFVGLWTFAQTPQGQNRFDAILPDPRLGELIQAVPWSELDGSGTVAAAIVLVWVKLLIAVLPAFAVSFFFCEQTWIYLLLRRSADGSEIDEVYLEPDAQPTQAPPEKIEPGVAENA